MSLLAFAIFALFILTILACVLVGAKKQDEDQVFEKATPAYKAMKLDILQTRLAQKKITIEEDGTVMPDLTYVTLGIALTLLCAWVGMTFSTIFFLACYTCVLFDLLEQFVDVDRVQNLQKEVAIDPIAPVAQPA